jgi:hypothetical protein
MIGCTPGFHRGGLAHLSHLGLHEIYGSRRLLVTTAASLSARKLGQASWSAGARRHQMSHTLTSISVRCP